MVIAIGALGGSGTRAVADILIKSGIYMGNNLNSPNDNLLFTSLFKNPGWYEKATEEEKTKRIALFQKYMTNAYLTLQDKADILRASYTNPCYSSRLKFNLKLLFSINRSKKQQNMLWGWKEPNTYMYLPELANFFPDLKYIHVIRNGLDMAFSKNRQQLINWGPHFNIEVTKHDNQSELAIKQLDFWIQANQYAIETGKNLLANNFYLLNHEQLCSQPVEEVDKLLQYLNLEIIKKDKEKLYEIPIVPSSNERYLNYDLSIFSKKKLEEVTKLGFIIKLKV